MGAVNRLVAVCVNSLKMESLSYNCLGKLTQIISMRQIKKVLFPGPCLRPGLEFQYRFSSWVFAYFVRVSIIFLITEVPVLLGIQTPS